jgi:aminopeptidase N
MRLNTFFELDFGRAFRTWENQAGYPLITVRYDIPSQSFRIVQQRYWEKKKENSNDTSSWYIPLNYATAANPNFEDTKISSYFIDGTNNRQIFHSGLDASQWYIFNKQQFGYYRVNYDENNWRALTNALNSDDYEKIHVLNRVQLIDDSMALAIGGYNNFDIAYDILKYLTRENDFFPFYAAYRYMNS